MKIKQLSDTQLVKVFGGQTQTVTIVAMDHPWGGEQVSDSSINEEDGEHPWDSD